MAQKRLQENKLVDFSTMFLYSSLLKNTKKAEGLCRLI